MMYGVSATAPQFSHTGSVGACASCSGMLLASEQRRCLRKLRQRRRRSRPQWRPAARPGRPRRWP
eukprot:15381505-Alexandrium_andersonii.AAC.1